MIIFCALAAVALLAASQVPSSAFSATTPRPLLECADVNADGPVSGGDIAILVSKYGRTTGQPGFHVMYEVGMVDGAVAAGDIGGVVADFGLACGAGRPDTQIAMATLWAIRDHPSIVVEDAKALSNLGYVQWSQELPNQGTHYIQPPDTWDNVFNPAEPEGLIYRNGKLAAQLYYVEGDDIGWGPVFPPPAPVDIDGICAPATCSWTGGADRWHLHQDTCLYNMRTSQAETIGTADAATCQALHEGTGAGGEWYWDERLGWMGHVWNHQLNTAVNPLDTQGNGRFIDDLATQP
jgi:hypothetical protein